jgi:hypothetical protein
MRFILHARGFSLPLTDEIRWDEEAGLAPCKFVTEWTAGMGQIVVGNSQLWRWSARGFLLQAVLIFLILPIRAQEPLSTLRSESNVVLVPTLVRTKAGTIAYGLEAKDFLIEDDGIEQDVTLDESPEREPVSLVVAIQVGRKASSQFKRKADTSLYDRFYTEEERKDCRLRKRPCPTAIGGLGSMLEAFMDATKGEVALVTFDSSEYLFQDFTEDPATLSERLKRLTPGDEGAAILDAIRYSVNLLDSRPKGRRHILLLISESRDHGSQTATFPYIFQQLAVSNTLVGSLTFSPLRSEFVEDLRAIPSDEKVDLLAPLQASIGRLRKNVAQGVADVTGGENRKFQDNVTFDAAFASMANDIRSSYLLSFQPSHPRPGPHSVRVRLRNPRSDLVLRARSQYWAVERHP